MGFYPFFALFYRIEFVQLRNAFLRQCSICTTCGQLSVLQLLPFKNAFETPSSKERCLSFMGSARAAQAHDEPSEKRRTLSHP